MDKQIIIDYKNICGNYSPKVGCTGTFDGSCIKEQCFTYKLLQQLQAKEQECEKLKNWVKNMMFDTDRNDWFEHFAECFENWKENLFKQLDKLKEQNDELKKVNNHIENNRKQKADKLMRIEKLIIACSTGYTDEFIQELLVILHEPEPVSFENKYLQTLTEIKEICNKTVCDYLQCSLNYNHSKDFECEKLLAIEQKEESLYYKSYKKSANVK